MKKIIIITIICFLIPCFVFAQGPDIISSIEGTLWRGQLTRVYVSSVFPCIETVPRNWKLGFSDGMMYMCFSSSGSTCTPQVLSAGIISIIMPEIGVAIYQEVHPPRVANPGSYLRFVAYLHPSGLGYAFLCRKDVYPKTEERMGIVFDYANGTLVREDDSWSP